MEKVKPKAKWQVFVMQHLAKYAVFVADKANCSELTWADGA